MNDDGVSALSWRTHQGQPVEEDRIFFERAPGEIGNISTADTTLRQGQLKFCVQRSAILLGLSTIPLLMGSGILIVKGDGTDPSAWLVVGLIGIISLIVGVFSLQYHECSYVGDKGIALYGLNVPKFMLKAMPHGIFLFEKARSLYVSSTRTYVNGVYSGTTATFIWKDKAGKNVFHLNSNYFSWKEKPNRDRTIHFARSAERAWTERVYPMHLAEREKLGQTGFPLVNGGGVFVGEDSLTLRTGGKDTVVSRAELSGFSVGGGFLNFHRPTDKSGLFGAGPLSVPYGSIGNAAALVRLLATELQLPLLGV
jgi:hypothetical protein